MNDLLRPSLYQAFHQISPLKQNSSARESVYDVVGPVCESADVLGYDRSLKIEADDILAVQSAGAYGFVMANNYNTRLRPPEILVDDDKSYVIRERETYEQLFCGELHSID